LPPEDKTALVEQMIVGTKSGLLIYESTLLVRQIKSETPSQDVHMSVRYKLSMLPDESVLDIVDAGENSKILVCCQGGSYVILTRSGNVMQETWRFRGFSAPAKSLIETGDSNKILVVEKETLAMIDLKRKAITKCKQSLAD
jgi:hypothetical protein